MGEERSLEDPAPADQHEGWSMGVPCFLMVLLVLLSPLLYDMVMVR